jgi:tetratricopeptide (TPR) repeat protein
MKVPILLFTGVVMVCAMQSLRADAVVLTSGQTLNGVSFRRTADGLVVTTEVQGPGGKPMNADQTVPLKEITRVECTPPAALKSAGSLLAQGNTSAALAALEPAVAAVDPLGDLPGSPWPEIAVVYAQALLAAGNDAHATVLIEKLSKAADTQGAASALQALRSARKGDYEKVATLAGPLLTHHGKPTVAATASTAQGFAFLAQKKYTEALLCFLEQPVFAPEATALAAMAQRGAAECYFGMEDFDRAIGTLEGLLKDQPSGPESKVAQTLLEKYRHRKQVIENSKK